jgi:hypothetical protein
VQRDIRRIATAVFLFAACIPALAAAQTIGPTQTAPDTNPGKVSLVATYDFTNAYMFRGLRQDDTRVIMFPFAEARFDLLDDASGRTDVALRVGTWNSLNTGVTGSRNGTNGKMWYESRFYSALDFTFGPGITATGMYTAYPSPNNSFSTVKEFAFRVGADESLATAGVALRPYGLVAFEFDTAPGVGQADGGLNRGTYLELGVLPQLSDANLAVTFPIKVGVSLDNYYELAGVDHKFGFLSLGAVASVPFARSVTYGSWDLHGGFEFQSLGDTPEAFNAGDQSKIIGTIGIGFSY